MNREDIFVGQTVKDGDEIVTVKEIFQQQNQSSSNDILVEDANGVSYSIYHEFLDFDDTAVNWETSIKKQIRLNCTEGISVDDWNCYRDCACWNGKYCTKYETEKFIVNNNITIDK